MRETDILLVDDDPAISELVRIYLQREGFTVRSCDRGDNALNEFRRQQPDLMILDIMLPGLDGWQVLKTVRKTTQVPVIMLSARDEGFDKVLGLELGADDYVTKPFDPKELTARVRAVLRRTQPAEADTAEKNDLLTFPQLTLSLSRYEVYYEGKRVDMPPKELEVLYYLAANKGQVFTRDQLLEKVWGFDFAGDSSRTVDVHVKRVREKLPECEKYGWSIRTVWGVGYKFEVQK